MQHGENRPTRPIRTLLLTVTFSAAMALLVGPAGASGLSPVGSVELCAFGGTCCPGTGTCYPNDCSNLQCAQGNHFWVSTGPCVQPPPG